jgi:hypothetical protein
MHSKFSLHCPVSPQSLELQLQKKADGAGSPPDGFVMVDVG